MAQRNAPLRLRFAEGELTVSAQTQDVGEAHESLPDRLRRRGARDRLQPRLPARRARGRRGRHRAAQAHQPPAARAHRGAGRELLVPDHAHPARGLIVREVTLRDFRSYASLELSLEPGVVLLHGPNGAGKTNLLEALHVGTQGFSPRARSDATDGPLRRGRGTRRARGRRWATTRSRPTSSSRAARRGGSSSTASASARRERLRHELDDARLHARPARGRQGRPRHATCVPRPGRRPAASRRGRRLPNEYASAVGQRNAASAASRAGSLDPRRARAVDGQGGEPRRRARATPAPTAIDLLVSRRSPSSRASSASRRRRLRYDGEPPTVAELDGAPRGRSRARRHGRRPAPPRPADRGRRARSPRRSARRASSGSPCSRSSSPRRRRCASDAGRLAARAARRRALRARRRPPRALAAMVARGAQTVVTATAAAALPGEPAQVARRHTGRRCADGAHRRRGRAGARPRRESRRDPARRADVPPGRPPSGTRSRGRRGRSASRGTERCTSRRRRRPGRTSSRFLEDEILERLRDAARARRRRRSCGSRSGPIPEPGRRRRSVRASRLRAVDDVPPEIALGGGLGGRRRSTIPSSASSSREPPARASLKARSGRHF